MTVSSAVLMGFSEYRSIAGAWRVQNGESYADHGFVLIYDGVVYGWKEKLINPHCEKPGVIAVDTQGFIYQAQGGNDYDGAERWCSLM